MEIIDGELLEEEFEPYNGLKAYDTLELPINLKYELLCGVKNCEKLEIDLKNVA